MKKHKQSIPEFAVTAAQLKQFHRFFAMHIIKAERPTRGCGLPLPEVIIHLNKRGYAADSAQLWYSLEQFS